MNGVEDAEWAANLATLPHLDKLKAEQNAEEE